MTEDETREGPMITATDVAQRERELLDQIGKAPVWQQFNDDIATFGFGMIRAKNSGEMEIPSPEEQAILVEYFSRQGQEPSSRRVECVYASLHFEVDPDHPSSFIVTEVGFGPPEGSTARDFFDALKPRDG